MSRPELPNYSSSENAVFHPVFESAALEALKIKGLSKTISVLGQYQSPTGPIDFVFFDLHTKKVIFPVEVKRTQSSVRGLGRRQARDYWANLGLKCQTKFYCVTNLELTELFRNDESRPRTLSQKVSLAAPLSGLLETTSKEIFYENLVQCLLDVLSIVLGEKSFSYLSGLSQFQYSIESVMSDPQKWHENFIPTCFEYIRGASKESENLQIHTKAWRQASFYSSNPKRLIQLGQAIDFEYIFREPAPVGGVDSDAFHKTILSEAYECGRVSGQGDDIAELVNEILAPHGIGIVETDMELAKLLGIISKNELGRELDISEKVIDPASGSGRLLTALPISAFPSLTPTQVWANEIESKFAESLSLRLGLAFSHTISTENSPKITISGVENLLKEDFSDVKLIVMNPPFLSGARSGFNKRAFVNRITEISGKAPILNKGQVALEILFLELVWHLSKNDTVIGSIFPIQHLYRLSTEASSLRRFLIKDFRLSHIVIYPSKGVFENVTKQTVILIGNKGAETENVKLIEVQKNIGDIDFDELDSGLSLEHSSPTNGVIVKLIKKNDMLSIIDKGWSEVINGANASVFISKYYNGYSVLGELPRGYTKRGTLGNGGNTELTVFSLNETKYPKLISKIPKNWVLPVLNNTVNMPRNLSLKTARDYSFLPPVDAYKKNTKEYNVLRDIVETYMVIPKKNKGPQVKYKHSADEIINKLKSDQKVFGAGWVLIQRASRKQGDVGILECSNILLSTNVLMAKLDTERERKLLASWLLSVFGQIQLELYGTPQEGMRKLEVGSLKKVAYPNFSDIPYHIEEQLINKFDTEDAMVFSEVKLRDTDFLWSKVIYPKDPDECISEALSLVQSLVDYRTGFGNS